MWKLHGLKIKYMPAANVNSTSNRNHYGVQIASFPDSTPGLGTADSVLQGKVDYRSYKGDMAVQRYYNLKKFYASRSANWLAIGTYYPEAATFLKVACDGYVSNDRVGTVFLCWYVAFKG